jgi:hypothetical protein
MKTLFFILILSTSAFAQIPQDMNDPTVIIGTFNRQTLQTQPGYEWYSRNYTSYKPDPNVIKELTKYTSQLNVKVFCGTWCDDSQNLLPKFLKVADACGMIKEQVILIGVDRDKSSGNDDAFNNNVTGIPLFIIYYQEQEIGRIMETVKSSIEKDMLDICKRNIK